MSFGNCCKDLADFIDASAERDRLRVVTRVGKTGEESPSLAWFPPPRRTRGFRWVNFCPFCGTNIRTAAP